MQNTRWEGINSYPDGLNNTRTKNDPVNAVTVNLSVKHRWDVQEEDVKKTKEQLKWHRANYRVETLERKRNKGVAVIILLEKKKTHLMISVTYGFAVFVSID